MAFSFFGKKDKNTPEAPAPVAKAPPTPPKIQTPPKPGGAPAAASAAVPSVRPPQPSGLIPATGVQLGSATTQPMVMPRAAVGAAPPPGSGLKPSRPGLAQSSRSTQRIVLPSSAPSGGAKPTTTKPLATVTQPTGRINLPIGMILRCLPQEVLASELSEFEASGAAATEVGLPMNMILSQLPSGKVEMPLSELIPHFPAGYLQPTESISAYLGSVISLPLMDVVMRIPPDLLALRPDQKDVDASVINMADPFTEEILREQAEAARRQQAAETASAQTNIIDESQVPQAEEFVPQAQAPAPPAPAPVAPAAAPVQKNVVPPPRPPTPPAPPAPVTPPPAAPSVDARTISASGRLPVPNRATSPVPSRPPVAPPAPIPVAPPPPVPVAPTAPPPTMTRSTASFKPPPPVQRQTASVSAPPVPPTPRQTGALPVAAIPRQTASLPQPPRPPIIPTQTSNVSSSAGATAPLPPAVQAQIEKRASEPPAPLEPPPSKSDDLQRLAALAMAQMKDDDEAMPGEPEATANADTAVLPEQPAATQALPEPVVTARLPEIKPPAFLAPPVLEPELEPEPEPEPVPEPAFEPPPVAVEEPAPVTAPLPEVRPAPVAMPPPRPPVAAAAPVAVQPPRPPTPVAPPAQPSRPPAPVAAPAPVAVRPPAPALVPPAPVSAPEPEPVAVEAPAPEPAPEAQPEIEFIPGSVAFNLNTCSAEELVKNIPGCFPGMAESIIRYRTKIGSFKRLEDLLDVPGITRAAYTNLTGEQPPENRLLLSLNELLGFPVEQELSLKDITDRIACWPDIIGCVLSQSSGLSLVGTVPQGLSKEAIVAFAPRMFDAINKSFAEITGRETDDLIIPTPGISFHIFRNKELYLIIISRTPLMPERHMKVARFVLAALGIRRD